MGTNREKSLEGLNLLGHLCQPWLSTSNPHWPETQTGYMVRNLNQEIHPVVAYAHNLSSFFPYFHHNTSTYSDYLLFLKGWDDFHSTKKWLKFFMSQAEEGSYILLSETWSPWSSMKPVKHKHLLRHCNAGDRSIPEARHGAVLLALSLWQQQIQGSLPQSHWFDRREQHKNAVEMTYWAEYHTDIWLPLAKAACGRN